MYQHSDKAVVHYRWWWCYLNDPSNIGRVICGSLKRRAALLKKGAHAGFLGVHGDLVRFAGADQDSIRFDPMFLSFCGRS